MSEVAVSDEQSLAAPVLGTFEPGFKAVAAAFAENFESRGEGGASCVVYVDGIRVVDLWGGLADRSTGRPWERDTRTLVFSCSKGVLSICAAMLVDRGQLDLDGLVADYWPEFAASGKQDVTVRMVLNHTSGLPFIDPPLSREQVLDWASVTAALAGQTPAWTPGEDFLYQGHTFGWLLGEVIRRITGLTPRAFLAREIAQPLGAPLSYGVASDEIAALAPVIPPLPSTDDNALGARDHLFEHNPMILRMLSLDGAIPFPGFGGDETYVSEDVLMAEMPAANLVTSADSLARVYAAAVSEVDGVRLVSAPVVREMSRWQVGGGRFEMPGSPDLRWASGFMIDSVQSRPMIGEGSFGHDGAGGSLGFGHLGHRLGFAYVSNQMGGIPDDRANALTAALHDALVLLDEADHTRATVGGVAS